MSAEERFRRVEDDEWSDENLRMWAVEDRLDGWPPEFRAWLDAQLGRLDPRQSQDSA